MKQFQKKFGNNGAYAKFYLQEVSSEIDEQRVFPTIVICPGGAYFWTSFREDEAVALRFLAEGFHVVVVHYPTEGLKKMSVEHKEDLPVNPVSAFPNPVIALAQAISFIKENASEFHVDLNTIVVGGFSAGGNVAGQLATHWHRDWLQKLVNKDKELYRPTHILLAYAAFSITPNNKLGDNSNVIYAATGSFEPDSNILDALNPIKNVDNQTPPCFIWHTMEDILVPSSDALDFCRELEGEEVPYELHLFNKGKHGLVLGDLRTGIKESNQNAQVYKWIDLFIEWVRPVKTQLGSFYEAKHG